MPSEPIIAGGGIVWRRAKDGIELLIVHRPNYDDWTFPKGKLDRSESIRQAAQREVLEETGLRTRLGMYLGESQYETPAGNEKIVHYWAMEAVKGKFKANAEVDKAKWLPLSKATSKLTYKRDRTFLQELGDRWWNPSPRVYLVRHAHAGDRYSWTGDDMLRPISDLGEIQTKQLSDIFADLGVQRIVSSPWLRCVQTVEPLAAAAGLELQTHEALAEGASPKKTAKLLRRLAAQRSVAVSHGDVIFATLSYLASEGMELPPIVDASKGSTWVLEPDGDWFARGSYWPPPS